MMDPANPCQHGRGVRGSRHRRGPRARPAADLQRTGELQRRRFAIRGGRLRRTAASRRREDRRGVRGPRGSRARRAGGLGRLLPGRSRRWPASGSTGSSCSRTPPTPTAVPGLRPGAPNLGGADRVPARTATRSSSPTTTDRRSSYDTDPDAWIAHACAVAGRNLTADEWRDAFGDRSYRKTCPGAD